MDSRNRAVMATGAGGHFGRAVAAAITQFSRTDVPCKLAGGFRRERAVHGTSERQWNFLSDLNTRCVLKITLVCR